MKKQPIFQVDAFISSLFGGSPAAVCPLQEWLPDELMQSVAMENNLSETAFLVQECIGQEDYSGHPGPQSSRRVAL